MHEPVRNFFARAAVDELLFHAAQLRKFRKNAPPTERRQKIGSVTDCRIGRKSGKTVRASALQSHAKLRHRGANPPALVRFHQPEKRFANRLRQHCGFGSTLLLFHYDQRLIEIRIPLAQLGAQNRNLRMLAAQAEHRCSSHVGMMNVAGNQSAQIARILPRPAAAAFVKQKTNAVHIFENPRTLRTCDVFCYRVSLDFFPSAISIEARQLRDLTPVSSRRCKTQFFLECLLQHADIPVLAEHQRHHDPIISRADLSVAPPVAEKRSLPPTGDLRWSPAKVVCLLVECRGLVVDIADRKKPAPRDGLNRFPHDHSVHPHTRPDR